MMTTRRRSKVLVFLAEHGISRLEFRRDMSDEEVFLYRIGLFRDWQNTLREHGVHI